MQLLLYLCSLSVAFSFLDVTLANQSVKIFSLHIKFTVLDA